MLLGDFDIDDLMLLDGQCGLDAENAFPIPDD